MSSFKAMRFVGITSLLFSFFTCAVPAFAAPIEEQIKSQIYQHFASRYPHAAINIVLNSINDQLKEKKCRDLSTRPPAKLPRGGRLTVRVQCSTPQRWVAHVTGKVEAFSSVATARNTLPKGKLIQAVDLAFQRHDLTTLKPGYFFTPDTLIGAQVRRTITSQRVINSSHIKLPNLVNKGDSVIIIAQKNGMSIRTQGTALDAGLAGDQIRVVNNRSQKVIKAYIKKRGQVTVFY
ncbi:flagellar basal body P-ring formation chaperone FlgA [Neptunomonas sp. XY-337]|uniref:flagellar basal body P-ring formation chaperone FlgA n=1 Tax=Neptunomonas sp. XY-337 TaxID=2561897 RepID=UPI0010AAC9B2|nr:flagellar basal body P-ring formation chaperone FlgA [Neptunomonas sp. XY-337]